MSNKTLIKGGCVLSMDRSVGNHAEADVLVEDDVIVEVGQGLRARGAEIIDAADTIVMPGFVDTHRHAWNSLFRNVGAIKEDYGRFFGTDDAYAATLIGLLGAVEAGITTVVDWPDIASDDVFTRAVAQAHADSGLRTVLLLSESSQTPTLGPRSVTAYRSETPTRPTLAAVSERWVSARESGHRIHAHAAVDPSDGGVIAELGSRGLLADDVTLVHCTAADDADLDAVASSGASVSLTPAVEMTAGIGSPPLQALIDRGLRPGLGVGGEGEMPGDMFAQMRAANSIQHATLFDLKLAGKGGLPNLLTTRDVIRYATVDGAKTAGLDAVTGTLTPGKQADIVVLRTDRPNIAPLNDPIGAVVWGMDTSNIDWVLVGGSALVREGSLVADVERARNLAMTAHEKVGRASGLLTGAGERK